VRDEIIAWKAILSWLDRREAMLLREQEAAADISTIESELMGYGEQMPS
jgi:hypothetical protein